MAAESSGRGTSKVHKSKTISQSTATVATTMKKKSSAANAKKEEENIKLVIRRLPLAMTKQELRDQIEPLPNEPTAYWFCPAPTDHELPRDARFARAYIAFWDEKDAVALAERFNGYVFVDKQGNESMAIVEYAPNQQLPKDLNRPAKECDIRSGTLENESQYQQFLEAYEQQMALGPRRVTDFDDLVRELEEKERRMQNGQVQETPLTAYISRIGEEKGRKKQQKLMERLERRQQFSQQIVTTDWAEVYRKEGIEIVSSGGGKKKEEKKQRKDEAVTSQKQRKANKALKKLEELGNGRGGERGQRQGANSSNANGGRTMAAKEQSTKKGPPKPNAAGNVNSETKKSPKLGRKSVTPRGENDENGNEATNENLEGKAAAKQPKKNAAAAVGSSRNRDRPEREIYRPGKTRLQSRKSTEPAANDGVEGDASKSKPKEQQK